MTHCENKRTKNTNTSALNSNAILIEMQTIVRRAADLGAAPGESVKAAIGRAAHRLGLTYRRTYTFWYGAHCAVLATEADRLRTAELRLLAESQHRLATELNKVTTRLNALERSRNGAKYSAKTRTDINLAWGEMQ